MKKAISKDSSVQSLSIENMINPRNSDYLKENLMYYIRHNVVYTRKIDNNGGWVIDIDYNSKLRIAIADYIIQNFTLMEVFIIFFEYTSQYGLEDDSVKCAKQEAIKSINYQEHLTTKEKSQLKRKVWDMNSLTFGLILELIHLSDLFWDNDLDCVIPRFLFNK